MTSTDDAPASKPAAGQTWNPEEYAQDAGFVPVLGSAVLDLLAPTAGETILDLGCGDGALTVQIAETGAHVMGADASPGMIEAARDRGLQADVIDGHSLNVDRAYDAVFSNAALHWMSRDPDAVVAGVARALKPGGRFVGEFGGHGNVAAIVTALIAALEGQGVDGASRMPWYFPTPDAYRQRLEAHGFKVETIVLIPRPTPLPTGMAGWLRAFADPFLVDLPDADRNTVLNRAAQWLKTSLCDNEGRWTADYVRLRFRAVHPE